MYICLYAYIYVNVYIYIYNKMRFGSFFKVGVGKWKMSATIVSC